MTHIQNIPHILQHGITRISSPNTNPNYVPIGDGSLIQARAAFQLKGGKKLGDYIPFYFGPRMPMLYVIQHGYNGLKAIHPENIAYCITTAAVIVEHKLDYLFTDGHAVDSFTSFYGPTEIRSIDNIIDKKAIQSKYWNDENDLDLKRRKEAEFLVSGDIPPQAIPGFAVYNKEAEKKIQSIQGFKDQVIVVKPIFYF